MKEHKNKFTESINNSIGSFDKSIMKGELLDDNDPYGDIFFLEGKEEELIEYEEPEGSPDHEGINDPSTSELGDKYLGLTFPTNKGGKVQEGTVLRRKRKADGSLIGTENNNPILDTRIYEIGFEDGSTHDLSTNTIIENIYESVDDTGHHFTLLKSIVDIRKDSNAIKMEDGMIVSENGIKKKVITTKG